MIRQFLRLTAVSAVTLGALVLGGLMGPAAVADAAPYPPAAAASLSASSYDPCAGASNIIGGSGFRAGETVRVVLVGGGLLGTPVASSDGSFRITVTIPLDARGTERITATGEGSGLTASTALDVPCVLGQSATRVDGVGDSGGSLAHTGVALGGTLLTVAVLTGVGAMLLVAGRRRRSPAR